MISCQQSLNFGGRMHVTLACRGAPWRRVPPLRKLASALPRPYSRRASGLVTRGLAGQAGADEPEEYPSFGEEEDLEGPMDGEVDVPDVSLDIDEEEIEGILDEGFEGGLVSEADSEAEEAYVGGSALFSRSPDEDEDLLEYGDLDSLIAAAQGLGEEEGVAGGMVTAALGAAAAAPAAAAAAAATPEQLPRRAYPQPPSRTVRLPQLLRKAGLEEAAELAPDIEITDIVTCNSQRAGPGALYVCVPANDSDNDGHDFVMEAAELGISAVLANEDSEGVIDVPEGLPVVYVPDTLPALSKLADAFFDHPSRRMRTVGLVGSYGKTTSAWLMRGMFEETGEITGLIGTIEYAIAEDRLTPEGDIWEADEPDVTLQRDSSTPFHATPYQGKYGCPDTTPDALHLHKTLAGIADRGASTTIVECHTAAVQDGRCEDVDMDVLVFTNLYPEAMEEETGGEAGHIGAVVSLFDRLTDPERQRAVVNIDDPNGVELAQRVGQRDIPLVTFAMNDKEADVYAERVKYTIWEVEVLVRTPLGRLQIIVPMLGRQNVYNVLAAVAVGIACGVPLKSVVAGIEAVDIIPGRSEVVDEGQPFSVVVDYARTPQQLERLLDDVHEAGTKRTLLVMGCPGVTSKEHRQAMAAVAHEKSETVFFTNDSPGLGFPDEIMADLVSGLPDEVLSKFNGSVYNNFQDMHRVPHWYQEWLMNFQSYFQRYIVEDRFSAIRTAIGMAKKGDVVLVVGRGHMDFMEYWDGEAELVQGDNGEEQLAYENTIKGWFDDRVECRNALTKLPYLEGISGLNRDFMPWTRWADEDRDVLQINQLMTEEFSSEDRFGGSTAVAEAELESELDGDEDEDEDDYLVDDDE